MTARPTDDSVTKETFEAAVLSAVNANSHDGGKWRSLERWFSAAGVRGSGALSNALAERQTRIRQLLTKRKHPGYSTRDYSRYAVLVLDAEHAAKDRSDPSYADTYVIRDIENERPDLPPEACLESVLILRHDGNRQLTPVALVRWGESSFTNLLEDWYSGIRIVDRSVRPVPGVAGTAETHERGQVPGELNRLSDDSGEWAPELDEGDEVLSQAIRLLRDFGGVILRGPPGTSKSWYARAIARYLAGDSRARVRFVQFHGSYQYEDFVEGYVPDPETGTFKRQRKHFLLACAAAQRDPSPYVLVVDELSRADPARVFGEALTYLESTKRGLRFRLTSGKSAAVPGNLIIIGTMNVFDKGVDEVDAAFERRFGMIELLPRRDLLEMLLRAKGVTTEIVVSVLDFFDWLQAHPNRAVRIGHAYFLSVTDRESLRGLWDHQLRFVFERAFIEDPDEFDRLEARWREVFGAPDAPPGLETLPSAG